MKILKVLAIGVTVGGIALAMNSEKANAAEWTPRSAEQIKAEIKGNEYTIVWGDTLSAISQATNITVQKLADMNKIANVDLIYAGNKLIFNGNVATVQNSNGETVAQSVIQPQDKVDSTKPVGQPVQDTTSNNSTTQNTTTPVTDNTVAGNTQTGEQTTENTETTPSTPENNGAVTQTPTQPDNNQNGSTGGNTGGEQTTPSQPSQPDNGGNQGGSTGGNGGTTTPEKPQEPTIVEGQIGNSGMLFATKEEANAWADKETDNPESQWAGYGFVSTGVIYSDGTTKWTVNFY